MIFEPVTPQNAEKLRPYYINCDYRLCEYSVGVKLMWGGVLRPAYCQAAGCLIVRNEIDGRYQFDFPVPGPEGDVDAALTLIEKYCTQQGVRPVISVVPEGEAGRMFLRYPVVRLISHAPGRTISIAGRTWQTFRAAVTAASATISINFASSSPMRSMCP